MRIYPNTLSLNTNTCMLVNASSWKTNQRLGRVSLVRFRCSGYQLDQAKTDIPSQPWCKRINRCWCWHLLAVLKSLHWYRHSDASCEYLERRGVDNSEEHYEWMHTARRITRITYNFLFIFTTHWLDGIFCFLKTHVFLSCILLAMRPCFPLRDAATVWLLVSYSMSWSLLWSEAHYNKRARGEVGRGTVLECVLCFYSDEKTVSAVGQCSCLEGDTRNMSCSKNICFIKIICTVQHLSTIWSSVIIY